MQPRKSRAYYGLSPEGRVCFQNGMPIRQCQNTYESVVFRGERLGDHIVSAVEQKNTFDAFRNNFPDDPRVTIFCSSPTDEEALEAASVLLRGYVKKQWADFEFVNCDDQPPRDPEFLKSLYILMGVHHQSSADWIRRWTRSRMGVPIWICLTAPKPVDWYQNVLGIRPDFLFSVKGSAVSAG